MATRGFANVNFEIALAELHFLGGAVGPRSCKTVEPEAKSGPRRFKDSSGGSELLPSKTSRVRNLVMSYS